MIEEPLQAGQFVRLHSGDVIVLVRREQEEWVCEYTALARSRGEVVFTEAFLRTRAAKA